MQSGVLVEALFCKIDGRVLPLCEIDGRVLGGMQFRALVEVLLCEIGGM